MPRRPPVAQVLPARPLVRRLVLGLALGLTAACSSGSPEPEPALGAVPVAPVASLTAEAQEVCRQVVTALPQELLPGISRRDTEPASAITAAWGDPAVTLRCGTAPGSRRDEVYTFDGVEWAMHDTGASRTWTTLEARVPVQVVVPDPLDQQAEMLGSLAQAVRPALS